ncbi:helix-turn-helix domain-containing protein [Streptomyces nodosus]|uniref:helix-turn-helix domain-containing protein n=1 Tax=Streptomyces nodosus TaxID=40318 RepID=UPI0036E54A85
MSTSRNPQLVGTERATVAADFAEFYRNGSSIRAIAEQTGRSYGSVRALLLEADVQLRPRGARRPH